MMETVFIHVEVGDSIKISGDVVTTGSVCTFLIKYLKKHHMKTATGSFLPPYIDCTKANVPN
ncbi:hypothetical protein ACJEBI_05520 [Bacillus salipaludis]|uniref:Uncharacterized protein n=2 Tax=Bacillus salipaludis TaxID=2547811 RepID=A0ABW8RFF0_9BACI